MAETQEEANGREACLSCWLLHEAVFIANGQEPTVWFEPGPELEQMQAIRAEDMSVTELEQLVEFLFEKVKEREPWTHLPAGPDEALLSNWLVKLRLYYLNHPLD